MFTYFKNIIKSKIKKQTLKLETDGNKESLSVGFTTEAHKEKPGFSDFISLAGYTLRTKSKCKEMKFQSVVRG